MTHLISALVAIIVASTNVSYNESEFSLRDGQLVPTGKFHGNAIVRIDDSYTCYGSHNVNCAELKGDANADGEVNISDLVAIQKFAECGEEVTAWGNADFNGDEQTDITDAEALKEEILRSAIC